MQIVEDKKALVFDTSDPSAVLSAIPSARAVGSTVVVPHREDEVRVLRNLGFEAPAPVLSYYKFPGKFPPYTHQRLTSAFLTMNKRCIVLNDIGTGKTMSALWAADYLLSIGAIKRVLVLSPLSTLERVWGDSLFESFYRRKYVVLHGTAAKRKKLLQEDAEFFIINHDGFEIILNEAMGMFDLIIVDEAAVLRNPGTDRFKAVRKYINNNSDCRLWLMTGTPTPNEPTDAWSLAKLIGNTEVYHTYTGFKDIVMKKDGKWKFRARPEAPEIVSRVLQPSIRFVRDECLDLPDTVYITKEAQLSKEQGAAYREMLKQFVTEVNGGEITAANEAVKMNKLVQIACGVAYDEQGENVYLPCEPRLKVLKETIEEVNGKCIIFVPLTGVLEMLADELGKKYSVAVVNGSVSANARAEIFRAFQHETRPEILLAHPATMAHGLTLTSAHGIIWYGPITSNEQYTQANGRTERIGKKHTTVVVHIQATDLERKIFGKLKGKQKLQGVLLDILGGIE